MKIGRAAAPVGARQQAQVLECLRQPTWLRQDAEQARREEQRWQRQMVQGRYLLAGGSRIPVDFPTFCFDRNPQLRLEASLPWSRWARNLREELSATVAAMLDSKQWTRASWRARLEKMLQIERWGSLWRQGNLGLCSAPRAPSEEVDRIVLHWDSCNSSAQCYDTLRHRALSAHLLVDASGHVLQLADLVLTCAFHAGPTNPRSIGIEVNNPVDPSLRLGPTAGRARVTHAIPHHTVRATYWDFTPIQKQRVAELVDVLTAHFGIPRALPPTIDAAGGEARAALVEDGFQGVLGHYHVSPWKADPGLSLWPVLRQRWQEGPRPDADA